MNQEQILGFLRKDMQYHTIIEMKLVFGAAHNIIWPKLCALERQGFVEKKIMSYTKGRLAYWRAKER